jgi:hypothetical protein
MRTHPSCRGEIRFATEIRQPNSSLSKFVNKRARLLRRSKQKLKQSSAIGLLNVEMARAVLQKVGIPIVNEAVGGDSGRKVYFYTETGRLRVSSLK